jgi:hypothetical protein
MTVYEPWNAARCAEIIVEHTHLEGATLVILQAGAGHTDDRVRVEPSRAEVHGVSSRAQNSGIRGCVPQPWPTSTPGVRAWTGTRAMPSPRARLPAPRANDGLKTVFEEC